MNPRTMLSPVSYDDLFAFSIMKLTKNQKTVLSFIRNNSPVSIFSIHIPGISSGWVMNSVHRLWRAGLIEYLGKTEVSFIANVNMEAPNA